MSDFKPFPPIRKDESIMVDYELATQINNSCEAMATKLTEQDKLIEVMGESYKLLLSYSADILSDEGLIKGQQILAQYKSYKAGREC